VLVLLNRLFRVEPGEWGKLLQFGLFGLLLQTGMGIGFAAGDAAFLSNVGADRLPVIFLLTPLVMVVYTAVFSVLMVRFSIDHVVDVTLALLIAGGAILWGLIELAPQGPFQTGLYYVLKLYLAMWYIALYTLFWNFTDAYFDIQDAKRLFPLFAAFCALGTTLGALIVSLFAAVLPMHGFLLVWAGVAFATAPVARLLRRRWTRIADTDVDLGEESGGVKRQLGAVARTFRISPYAVALTLTLFVTLLMTNLAEFQYSTVLQEGRSEAELAALFGRLYAGANIFNLVVCLFVFNRLVTRIGVRNVALILPATYFAVFGVFFLAGGELAALAAFFAYHGVLTSIEYNNQNLLFNATPSDVKRPFRTVVEGLCEPTASLLAGAFLLVMAKHMDMRELSGIGVLLGAVLIGVVMALRHYYPAAMEANMRRGWLNFGDRGRLAPPASAEAAEPSEAAATLLAAASDPSPKTRRSALEALSRVAGPADIELVSPLVEALPGLDRESRAMILRILAAVGDVEAIPQILAAVARLSPRELRAAEAMMVGMGEAAIPRLMQVLGSYEAPYRARAVAARALSTLSHAQFLSQLDRLVGEELQATGRRMAVADRFEAEGEGEPAMALLAEAYRERIAASVDFSLELLALGGRLPDFDLLVVSLHSANPKVRGNAIETIASGVDHATWKRLEPLIRRKTEPQSRAADEGELVALLDAAVEEGHPFEAAAAAQALRAHVPAERLAEHLRGGLRPGATPVVRDSFATLLGLDAEGRATVVDLVAAIRTRPEFTMASIEAQVALAQHVSPDPPAGRAVALQAAGSTCWLSAAVVEEVAARYPDLALAMLKASDDRAYAA
jgi:hypothetical protein